MTDTSHHLYSDIDFLDDYDWSINEDQYQLVYGILYDSVHAFTEPNIYNRIVKLIEQYKNTPVLRTVKIKSWIDFIVDIKNELEKCVGEKKNENPTFHFPFLQLRYNETAKDFEIAKDYKGSVPFNTLVKYFDFTVQILETFRDNEKLDLTIYKTENFEYPLENLYIYLVSLADHYFKKGEKGEKYDSYNANGGWYNVGNLQKGHVEVRLPFPSNYL